MKFQKATSVNFFKILHFRSLHICLICKQFILKSLQDWGGGLAYFFFTPAPLHNINTDLENRVLSADKKIRKSAQSSQLGLGSACQQWIKKEDSLKNLVDLHVSKQEQHRFIYNFSKFIFLLSPLLLSLTFVKMSAGDIVLAAISIFVFIWDFLTWPIYQAIYKPWEKRKALRNKNRARTVR